MSNNNGHLLMKSESAKLLSSTAHETHKHHQPTYIIIYKQNENVDDKKSQANDQRKSTSDIVRRNLADIDVDDYDSSFSTAKIFLDNDENIVSSHKEQTVTDANDPDIIKRNLFHTSILPVVSSCNTDKPLYSKVISTVTSGDKNEQDSGVFCTPTSSENLKSHCAVRKIVLISSDSQTALRGSPIVAQTLHLDSSSPQFSPNFSVPQVPLATSTPVTSSEGHLDALNTPDSGFSPATSFTCSTPVTPFSSSTSVGNISAASTSSVSSGFGHLHVSDKSVDSGENAEHLDTSLANIHWLKGFSLSNKKHGPKASKVHGASIRWMPDKTGSDLKEIKLNDHESSLYQRPPYSYMSLIQMALRSREDKKMTLKEICCWVESTFPYYKYTAKPGWKNSIRHNLSFYQCFVRDKAEKKKHGAHWTLQFDDMETEQTTETSKITDQYIPQSLTANEIPGMIPLFVNSPFPQQPPSSLQSFQHDPNTSKKRRTGPLPILPRPSPMQAYALVPIQSVPFQAMQNSPIIVHVPNTLPQQQQQQQQQHIFTNITAPIATSVHTNIQSQATTTTTTSSLNSILSSTQPLRTSVPATQHLNSVYMQSQNMTMITMTPKEYSVETSTTNYSKIQLTSLPSCSEPQRGANQACGNVINQAWMQAERISENQAQVAETSLPHTSGNRCEQQNDQLPPLCDSDGSEQKCKRQKTNSSGLPKPKMYMTHPRKKTRSRIKKQLPKLSEEKELLADSSDSESENKLFGGLPTPLRLLFDSDNTAGEPRVTSTPLRNVSFSSDQLPSPIRGLTPLKCGSLFDGSFLDNLQEDGTRTIKLLGSPLNIDGHKNGNNSFAEYGIVQISPDQGLKSQNDSENKHSLSNLLADFPIDVNFMDDGDGLPVEFSVLNWSNLQQHSLNKSPSDT